MSKHWDPEWKKESVTVKMDPEAATRLARARVAAGLVPPVFESARPCMEDGVSRMAIVGPDFGAIVPAPHRVRAAPQQRELGRFTWYFVCTRPRITAVPGMCRIAGGRAEMSFDVARDDGSSERWSFSEPQGDDRVKALEVVDEGELLRVISDDGPAEQIPALVAQGMRSRGGWSPSDLDLEIRYIGRARGRDGETSALDRLESHEKYQRVLEELREPQKRNRDPWLVLSSGATIDTLTATEEPPTETEQREHEEIEAEARKILTENVRVDLVEALLINYFKPPLNVHHVESLDLEGSILKKCREARLTGVGLGISSAELGVAYYTAHRPRNQYGALTVCL